MGHHAQENDSSCGNSQSRCQRLPYRESKICFLLGWVSPDSYGIPELQAIFQHHWRYFYNMLSGYRPPPPPRLLPWGAFILTRAAPQYMIFHTGNSCRHKSRCALPIMLRTAVRNESSFDSLGPPGDRNRRLGADEACLTNPDAELHSRKSDQSQSLRQQIMRVCLFPLISPNPRQLHFQWTRPPPPHQSLDTQHCTAQLVLLVWSERVWAEEPPTTPVPGRTRLKAASSSPAAPHCSCPTCLSRSRWGVFPSPQPPFSYYEALLVGLVGTQKKGRAWTCHFSPLTRRLGSNSDHKPLVTSSFSKVFSHCLDRLSPHFTWHIPPLLPEVLYSACRPPYGPLERAVSSTTHLNLVLCMAPRLRQ